MKLRNKKTGEIVDFRRFCFYQTDSRKFPSRIYESLSDLNEEWEDAEDIDAPSKPLIKDEKVRKAVRAWADANKINLKHIYNTKDVEFNHAEHSFKWINTSIEFNTIAGLEELEDGAKYTIAELCREEEG